MSNFYRVCDTSGREGVPANSTEDIVLCVRLNQFYFIFPVKYFLQIKYHVPGPLKRFTLSSIGISPHVSE